MLRNIRTEIKVGKASDLIEGAVSLIHYHLKSCIYRNCCYFVDLLFTIPQRQAYNQAN